jgi:hypothetical protein
MNAVENQHGNKLIGKYRGLMEEGNRIMATANIYLGPGEEALLLKIIHRDCHFDRHFVSIMQLPISDVAEES